MVNVRYKGWTITAPDYDELEAYKAVIDCFPICEEEPRDESMDCER